MVGESQRAGDDRAQVVWHEAQQQWRWILSIEGGKTHAGWADTEEDAWAQLEAAKHGMPYRGDQPPV